MKESGVEASRWWKFFVVVVGVLFVLAFVTFNLGLLVSFTVKKLFWNGLSTPQVWVGGIVASVVLYALMFVRMNASEPGSTTETDRRGSSFFRRVRRSFWVYMVLNGVVFLVELIVFYFYRSPYLREFLTTVFPVFSA